MKPLNVVTLRYLKNNKKRTISTILAIALSSLLMFSMAVLVSSLQENWLQETMVINGTHHVKVESTYDKIEILKKNTDIETIETISMLEEDEISNEKEDTYYVMSVTGTDSVMDTFEMKTGRKPENDHEIIFPVESAYHYHLNYSLGEIVTIQEHVYTIVGFYENNFYTSQENINQNIMGFTKYDASLNSETTYFYVTFKSVKNAFKKSEQLAKDLSLKFDHGDYIGLWENTNLLNRYGESNQSQDDLVLGVFLFVMTILGIACTLIIYNSFAISVSERKKMYGIFSSIGATPWQVLRSIFFEALIVGGLGLILGILFTLGLSYLTLQVFQTIGVGVFQTTFHIALYPTFYYVALIFAIGVILLSAYFPAKRASEITPIEAIRGNQDIKWRRKHYLFAPIVRFFTGIEGEYAYKSVRRNKKKYRITTIAITLGIVLFICGNLIFNIIDLMYHIGTIDTNVNGYIELQISDKEEDKILAIEDTLLKTFEEGAVFSYTSKIVLVESLPEEAMTKEYQDYLKKIENTQTYFLVASLDPYNDSIYRTENHFSKTDSILHNAIQYSPNFDETMVLIPLYDTNKIALTFCEITSDHKKGDCSLKLPEVYMSDALPHQIPLFGFPTLIVDCDTYQKIPSTYQDGSYGRVIYIESEDFLGAEEKINEVLKNYEPQTSELYNAQKELEVGKRSILLGKIVVYGVIGLLILVATTSIFTTVHTGILLRRKEFAMLRSMGLSQRGFRKILYLESLFFGLKSFLYGFLISNAFIYILNWWGSEMYNEYRDTFLLKLSYPWLPFLISFLVLFTIVLVTMLYSSKKMRKENVMDALTQDSF